MADEENPGGAPAPEQTPAPAILGGAEPAETPDTAGAAPGAPAAPDYGWRDGEREEWAGGDEKLLARLKRFASPRNVYKSYLDLTNKVSAGQLKAALPDNPSDEEVAAYRSAMGVPDTPEGYELALPEGADESQAAELAAWSAAMHKSHAPPQFVKAAFDEYKRIAQENAQKQYEKVREQTIQQVAELRSEYGRDYQKNTNIANQFAVEHLGADKAPELMTTRLADGTFLGDHPAFVRLMVNAGLASMGDIGLIQAESGAGGQSIDDQYQEALAIQRTDPRKYATKEHQDRLFRLKTAQLAMRERQSGRAA